MTATTSNSQRITEFCKPYSPKVVSYHYPIPYIKQSLPVEGGSQREPLANDLLRERIAHIGAHMDLHKQNPSSTPI